MVRFVPLPRTSICFPSYYPPFPVRPCLLAPLRLSLLTLPLPIIVIMLFRFPCNLHLLSITVYISLVLALLFSPSSHNIHTVSYCIYLHRYILHRHPPAIYPHSPFFVTVIHSPIFRWLTGCRRSSWTFDACLWNLPPLFTHLCSCHYRNATLDSLNV